MKRSSKYRQYHSWTAFLDLLFNTLLAFAAFFMLAFLLVNPKVKFDKNVEAKAEVIITVTWPKENHDDVDTYVEDPIGALVFFQRKEDGLMHLDRDDLGHDNDYINTPAGRFKYDENREIVTLRGLIPGEYTINVHMYSKRDQGPVEVTVMLEKINPSLKLYGMRAVTLTNHGDEETAFRFTIDKDGEITNISHLKKVLAGPRVQQSPIDSDHGEERYEGEPGE